MQSAVLKEWTESESHLFSKPSPRKKSITEKIQTKQRENSIKMLQQPSVRGPTNGKNTSDTNNQSDNGAQKNSDIDGIQQALKIYYKQIGRPNVQFRIHTSKQSKLESILAVFCRVPMSVITPVGFFRFFQPYFSIFSTCLMEYCWLLFPVGLLFIKYVSFGSIFAMVLLTLLLIAIFMYAETFKEKEKTLKELIWAENRGQVVRKTTPKKTSDRFKELTELRAKQLQKEREILLSINAKKSLENDVRNLEDAVFGDMKTNGDGSLQIRIQRLSKQLGQKLDQNSFSQMSIQELSNTVEALQDVVYGGQN
eukprot:TRINITY_DN5787_c0_g2_i1.p1 TRINITY_DN5787_c0_g2~~TRINITY_DN5787_c0_g2_i1.p1  ORF type:complete len:318 (-),score=49.39 TRINITY_DN5787_c0_g2_i1:389-1318(-)